MSTSYPPARRWPDISIPEYWRSWSPQLIPAQLKKWCFPAESRLRSRPRFLPLFFPERVDPGNPKFQTRNIPKVVGGITAACTQMGGLFYRRR